MPQCCHSGIYFVTIALAGTVNLSRFYKLYACNKSIRIVYRLLSPQKVEIVEIWGIGKRDKLEIYKIVGNRLNQP
ncbi:MAG: hypothetical protein IJ673_08685 [Treponema sp.]|nr:hypothetical protein [Treponema sp.]